MAMAWESLMSLGWRRFSNWFLLVMLSIRSSKEDDIVKSVNEGSLFERRNLKIYTKLDENRIVEPTVLAGHFAHKNVQ